MDADILAQILGQILAVSEVEFATASGAVALIPLLVSQYAGRVGSLVVGAFDAGADHIFPLAL